MFISIGYIILYLYEAYKRWTQANEREDMGCSKIVAQHARIASLVLRATSRGPALSSKPNSFSPLVQACPAGWLENTLLLRNGKEILHLTPKMKVNLNGWVSYLQHSAIKEKKDMYVLLETAHPENEDEFLERSLSIPRENRVKVVDCVSPVAWKSGSPFGILAECDEQQLAKLCTAFLEGHLMLDDLLELTQITTVDIEGKAANLLTAGGSGTEVNSTKNLSPYHAWDYVLDDLHSSNVDQDSNESLASGVDSTIRDFMASDRSVDDTDKMTEVSEGYRDRDQGEDDESQDLTDLADGGEGPSDPVEDLAPETLTPVRRKALAESKPPNILIYCGKKDSQRQFEMVRSTIQQCVNSERYVIYNLKHDQVLSTPWIDNTLLLIISSEKVYDGVDQAFLKYFLQGGLLMSFGSTFDELITDKVTTGGTASVMPMTYKHWRNVTTICTKQQYSRDAVSKQENVSLRVLARDTARGNPLILEASHDLTHAAAILAQVNLDKDATEMAISPEIFAALKKANARRCEILGDLLTILGLDTKQANTAKLSSAALFTTSQDVKSAFTTSIEKRCKDNILRGRGISVEFIQSAEEVKEAEGDMLPVVLNPETSGDSCFSFDIYKSHLSSKYLGHTVIYANVISSTMNVIECLMLSVSEEQGLVAVAGQQTQGRGRGSNAWLSPLGCLMYSLHLRLSLSSRMGQSLGLVQHIAAVSVVHGIRRHPQYQDLDLRLKWPNDIYFGDKVKLGGILVQSSVMGDTVHMNIGIGINVNNKNPTACINDLIEQKRRQHGSNLDNVSLEQVLAYSLTSLEELVDTFQNTDTQAFFDLYHKYWLHSDAQVFVESQGQDMQIVGLDSQGYLKVKSADGALCSLQPDGNSFDMMRNLIYIKS